MVSDSFQRISALARNTFTEGLRQRFFSFLVLLGVALAIGGSFLRVFNFGNSELRFVADFGFGGMYLFGSILAIVMTAHLFFSEMDNRTVLTLLARPVRRWEFFAGKFAGVWVLLGMFVGALSFVLGVLLQVRAWELGAGAAVGSGGLAPPDFNAGGLAMFALLQWVRLGIVAAVSFFICAFAQTFLYSVVVATMAVLAAQLSGVVREVQPGASGDSTWLHTLVAAIGRVIPDLQMFDLGVPLVLETKGVPAGVLGVTLGTGGLYILLLLALAVWTFMNREI